MFPLHYAIFSALWSLKAIIKQLSLSSMLPNSNEKCRGDYGGAIQCAITMGGSALPFYINPSSLGKDTHYLQAEICCITYELLCFL